MFSSCVCFVLCRYRPFDGPITRSEGSYRFCVCVCLILYDIGTLTMRQLDPNGAVVPKKVRK